MLEFFCNGNQLETEKGKEALLKTDLSLSMKRFILKSHKSGVSLQLKMSPQKKKKNLQVQKR